MELSKSKSINLVVTIHWTGLLDSRKLPLEEKRTAMCRAKTRGHKMCSSFVVAHLNVAQLFLFLDRNLGVATSRSHQQVHMRTMNCMWRACMCDAVFQSGWVVFTCPYCCLIFLHSFFVMNAECGTRSSSPIVIDSEPRFSILDFVFGMKNLGSRLGFT